MDLNFFTIDFTHDPYKMVLFNIISSIILGTALFVYKFIYPKRNINLFALLLVISILPVLSIFRPGTYESGDFNIHVYRAIAFYDALKDGQFIPSWAGELNATYGYQLFIFNYSFPYYIISFFHFLGFTFISSMKLFLASVYILSGITMFMFVRLITKSNFAAFISSIFYLFAPYHLVDLHFRNTAGELTAFVFIPLFFLSAYNFLIKKNSFYFILTAFIYILLNMSHMATSAFATLALASYTLYLVIRKLILDPIRTITLLALSLILGLIGSIHVWIPYLTLSKYTYGSDLTSGNISLTPLTELLYSPWKYGFLFQGSNGELSFIIGYIHLAILLFSFMYLFFKRDFRKNSEIFFWALISLVLIFLITPYSVWIWKNFPALSIAMFSYRLLLITTFCISVLAGFLALKFVNKRKLWIVIIFLAISTTILNWGHRQVVPQIDDEYLKQSLPQSTYQAEAFCCYGTPIWINSKDRWFKNIPENHIEIISGSGLLKEIRRTSINHKYIIYSDDKMTLLENTLYFPGWSAYLNKSEIAINYTSRQYRGLMVVEVPKGLHALTFEYKDVPVLFYSKVISILTILFCLIYLLTGAYRKIRLRNKRI